MKIKNICIFMMLVIHCVLINNYYHKDDISLLYRGINAENNMILLAAYFLYYCAAAFYIFEETEKYLNGYGKYVIIRNKKRKSVLNKMYLKGLYFTVISEIFRFLFYAIIAGYNNTRFKELIIIVFVSIIVTAFMIFLQVFLELILGSKFALAIAMIYYMLSCTLGGVLIKENIYTPLIFLIPNYSMNLRNEYMLNHLNFNYLLMIAVIILMIICLIISGKTVLRKKDIF